MTEQGISRRRFLQIAGITTVAVAGGVVWRATDQGVFSAGRGPAYEPWATWQRDMEDGPLHLVRAGILAANPHNTQPWYFQVSDAEVTLFADTDRHLGAMDPYLREMHLGLGCAVENMMLAAAAAGYDVDLALADGTLDTESAATGMRSVATLTLSPGDARPSPLFDAIPNRHTDRYDYSGDPVAPNMLDELAALNGDDDIAVFFYPAGTPTFAAFQAGTVAGAEYIVNDAEMAHDSFAWFPQSWDEVQRDKAGPYIDTAGVPPTLRAVVKMVPGMPSQAAVDSTIVADAARHFETASAAGIIAVRSLDDVSQNLRAGRLWQRLHLWGTANGLAMQPHNEMPEVVDRQRQLGLEPEMAARLAAITGDAGWRPTFTFRLGWPTVQPLPSARRPAEEVLVTSRSDA